MMQKKIHQILQDYYDCTGISIGAFDRFDHCIEVICNVDSHFCACIGSEAAIHTALEKLHTLQRATFVTQKCPAAQYGGVSFAVCYINPAIPELGCFAFGPFAADKNTPAVPYKPPHAVKHLVALLRLISNSHMAMDEPIPSAPRTASRFVSEVTDYIQANMQTHIPLEDAAAHLEISKSYLCRQIKQETGLTFTHYVNRLRVEHSKLLLADETLTLMDVALAVGFNSQSYYCRMFKRYTQLSPQGHRQCSAVVGG